MQQSACNPILIFNFADAEYEQGMQFTHPVDIIAAYALDKVRPCIRQIESYIEQGFYAAGFLSYEAAPAFDPAMVVRPCHTEHDPLLWFGIYEKPEPVQQPASLGAYHIGDWAPTVSKEMYKAQIDRIHKAIERGETYQVNYTMRMRAPFEGDAYAFYETLKSAQQAKYAAYLNMGQHKILSVSPELFFRIDDGNITTAPMKGTTHRGRWPAEDEAQMESLRHSEKDQAENVMIVDLLRNDLGRIAEIGSVHVTELFKVEPYPTVFQLTSTITAKLRQDANLTAILTALFPCGSVTGAPKVSTMKLIKALETHSRGVYCGTVGYLQPNGDAIFNVAIRTVEIDQKTHMATYGTGGGITWDSVADIEYQEAYTKTRVLTEPIDPFQLLETIRYEQGAYVLLERHLARLVESAQYFAIPLDLATLRSTLETYAHAFSAGERYRVRLLVGADGKVEIEHAPLTLATHASQPVTLAQRPMDPANRFFYHKTTHRDIYAVHRQDHPDVFDVLLWNPAGEITEFTIGNIVIKMDGALWTPPRACGLLAGTLRAELIANNVIQERILVRDALHRAEQIWLINSVRGWVPVHLIDTEDSGQAQP